MSSQTTGYVTDNLILQSNNTSLLNRSILFKLRMMKIWNKLFFICFQTGSRRSEEKTGKRWL